MPFDFCEAESTSSAVISGVSLTLTLPEDDTVKLAAVADALSGMSITQTTSSEPNAN